MSRLLDEAEDKGYRYMCNRVRPGLADITTNQCAQSVIFVAQELFDLDICDAMLQATGPLPGGFVVPHCGAFLSGLLVVGVKYGPNRSELASVDAFRRGLAKVQEFAKRFDAEFGSRYCKELSGYDLSIPEERAQLMTPEKYETCCKLVGKTLRIVGEVLGL